MTNLVELCADFPRRRLEPGETLLTEGQAINEMYVVASGSFVVSRAGQTVAMVNEPGVVFGEVSTLLDTATGATVQAADTQDRAPNGDQLVNEVLVIDRPAEFMADNPAAVLAVAKILAARLNASTAYLSDLQRQYGATSGNLGMVDEVLAKLAFGHQDRAEPGSAREPDPEY